MKQYVLYKKDSCPFCQKVMIFMKEHDVQGVEMKDIIEDPSNKDYLVEHGGKNQVPCLFIDGEPLYESNDIIQYMRENLLKDSDNSTEPPAIDEDPTICPF